MVDADNDPARRDAIERVKAKRSAKASIAVYVIVNVALWIIWAVTKDQAGGTSVGPWPIWVTLGWGIGLAFQIWNAYGRRPISESDIEREMRRGQ